jgi:uncharacterized protein YecE (DUF72 family)
MVYIGTSGWNYKHWKSRFYPPEVKQKDWLAFLAERFNTVEVNTSFYRIPKKETVQHWAEIVPVNFRFAVKLWRGITHYKKLVGTRPYVESFLDVVDALPPKMRAPMLIQLPPNQGKNVDKLRDFLREFQDASGGQWRVAVEFRNSEWLSDDVYRVLDEAGAAICLHDMAGRGETERENDASFVYVRRHGSGTGKYAGRYSSEQIAADAKRVRSWAAAGKEVFVYYNNDIDGWAIVNAGELREKVGRLL